MSVFIPIPIELVQEEREQSSRTYAIDWAHGRILGMVDGLDAVRQAIKKALLSPRFRCLVYDSQYGSEIKHTITARDATKSFIQSELPRLVSDALSVDSRVLNTENFEISFSGDEVHVRFSADTIFGRTLIDEVI